jgi:anaerobic magnesium-protoporphyrin IX monomethyl ester cyclase
MKIKVINPPNQPFSSPGILIEPIDALNVASFIAGLGHEVSLIDMDIRRLPGEDFTRGLEGDTRYDLAVVIHDYHIPLHQDAALADVREIARQAQAHGAKVVVGGKAATYNPQGLLDSEITALVRHEMEPALEVLLQGDDWSPTALRKVPGISFRGENGGIVTTARGNNTFDLERLPIPDRGFVPLDEYIDVRTILSSRGCHMTCDFCHVPGFWGAWRGRGAASVVDEIEQLVTKHGAKKILFLDDNATVNRKRMKEICRGIRARGLRVALGCLGSLSLYDRAMMEEMHAAGFRWIHYGVESGDDAQLAGIHKKITAEEARRIVRETRDIGFRVRTSWIVDLPGTTEDQLRRTADLILEMRTEEIRLHHLALRMGSRLREAYADLPSTQYIHQGRQNQNLCQVAPERLAEAVEGITRELGRSHAVVTNPDEFIDLAALKKRSADLQIVSLCPLRYGLGWQA